ncbi:methionine adenosyltransferase [Mycoplasmopsis cynos]|uniref:S-adenosylmethionine synthase n=1 Tax=Mycoplasmopsis cynos (strain C142) TaxID=1246955 RepID=L0RY31_MYCC1|nr:methionine adenosyltransferase [Mycoplasmopsis cynos]WQQ13172.1 methionine adenosyltransferase [Mycoplasmopsis cynos]WQQ14092.1 methionine adenosyltransferase [Mycoplasmopsis cynos]WQQ14712.1 methionine adenosyltransferase [Mycoplasmopsis cynos]WQQ16143.1 methionine adenosyltransferase [Mycoplasmopsis cynos]WQQ17533.1 methionine adenosyltransferase [Mycoplasmopsis cynos]
MKKLFTSESVGKGHPDKLCDQISDAILDAYLTLDPSAKVAIETMASGHNIFIAGEVKSTANIYVIEIAINILKSLNYFTTQTSIITDIRKQSSDITMGVELENYEIGAGDQGIMFGYATNETDTYMPLAITLAHELVKKAETLRANGKFKWAKADMKTQVTVDYSDPNQTKIDTVLMSVQHSTKYVENEFKNYIKNEIILPTLNEYNLSEPDKILINPTGQFTIGGPIGDTGLTGRKIIVDTYGGASRHGGGAFSGKDATKVDRSAAYAARWVAKNLVAAGVADRLEIQLSYAIGIAQPVSVMVETFGTEKIDNQTILSIIDEVFDLTPKGIIDVLELRKPIYAKTSYFGHFGRKDVEFPWEKLNRVEQIKTFINQSKN